MLNTIEMLSFAQFDAFYRKYFEQGKEDKLGHPILIFKANNDPATNQSWCPDCVEAKPVIDNALKKISNNDEVVTVDVYVGQRDEWKRPDNPFRLHELKITCVPTIVSLRNGMRLNGSECSDEDKVTNLFMKSLS